ncbi:MAG: phage tail spike protein [Clostridium sp.]|nr:phage tail spike protein [Clostridium sp.]MDU7085662.1 phage tail spike protein [Clostridium sp.]
MIPKLYNDTSTSLLGELNDLLECKVTEERNGQFELALIYVAGYPFADDLIKENIIVAHANDTLLNQKFRIYNVKKITKKRIKVLARHISFDLNYDFIKNINLTNQSCEYALNTIFRNSQFSKHYRGYSNIVNAQNYKISKVNCLKAIAGAEGSIIDTFGTGAEILRDNENIHVLNARGHDNGVVIEYAKNLTGFDCDEDITDLITRIYPYATYTNENNEEITVTITGDFVDSPLINNYSHPYIRDIDFSDKFEDGEIPTEAKLISLANAKYTVDKVDIVKCSYKIEFIPLSKCVGYEGLDDRISLCDKVTIKHNVYRINTQAKVIKAVYNVLIERYHSMSLGEPRTTLGDVIGGSGEDGKQGPPGKPGVDGTHGLSVFITYHDSLTLPAKPTGNGTVGGWHTNSTSSAVWMSQKVASDSDSGAWGEPIKIKGEQGPQGPPGEEFPNTLPNTPTLSANVYGFTSIELNWTFESKVYYTYELYASKAENFTPNVMDLICEGQVSSFLFQAKPGETWYFRVCGKNSYGKRTAFSTQVSAVTTKVDDLSNYVDNAAIGDALIGTLSFDRGWAGTLAANYIDARNLSVTDGNGLRTLDIDSYGNVNLNVASLKIIGRNVATEDSVRSVSDKQIELENANKANEDEINNIKNNGVGKVKNSIVTIDNAGIKVGRENSQFENLQSETGNYMYSYGKEIARYDKDGLKTSYAVLERAQVGHLRFENGVNCQHIHYIEDLNVGGITVNNAPMAMSRKIETHDTWEVN